MNSISLMRLLKVSNMMREAHISSVRMEKVFTDCLKAEDEQVIIITDSGEEERQLSPILGAGYFLAAKRLDLAPTLLLQSQKSRGEPAESHIESVLEDSGYQNIIILVAHSLGSTPRLGKSFRNFAQQRKHKFVSCTGLASLPTDKLPLVLNAIDIDYPALRKKAFFLKEALDAGKELHITTPAGTDLWMEIRGKEAQANDGNFGLPGRGGNLPTGEVYIAPCKKRVEGKIVIDGSSRHIKGTVLVRSPITLAVKGGEVTEIQGEEEARLLEKSLEWAYEHSRHPWGVRRVSEFGIGINPRASVIGAMIVDEKSLGTAHIALGSNHWFGGTVYSIIHLDQVFRNPQIEIDGKPLDRSLYT